MTPVPGRPAGRAVDWSSFERPSGPRRAVAGGVKVPRSWKPSGEEAVRLEVVSEGRTTPGIGQRGRAYARAGQVVEVRLATGGATAAIQGSDDEPYAVSLAREADGDVQATCTCPYGCDAVEWCKHAAALAFVVAHLVDTDAGLAATWSGAAGPASGGPGGAADDDTDDDTEDDTDDDGRAARGSGRGSGRASRGPSRAGLPDADRAALVAALRSPAPAVDARAQWRSAAEVVPLP